MKIKEKKNTFTPLTVVLLCILILYCLSMFYLLYWGVITSLKANAAGYEAAPFGLLPNLTKHYFSWVEKRDALQALSLPELITQYGPAGINMLNELNGNITSLENVRNEMGSWMNFYAYKHVLQEFTMKVSSYSGHAGREVPMWQMYVYSFLYAGGCAFVSTAVPCIAAYACARFKFRFSRFMHTLVVVVMMIPIVGSLPSEIALAQSLGVYNEIWGLWIMKANFLGLYFLMFYDVCKALPTSFSEAAKIDGANNFQIFFKISLPLIRNTFFTVLLIRFIGFWNDYQTPMVFMPSFPTIALGLNSLVSTAGKSTDVEESGGFRMVDMPSKMAAVVLAATPVCILFAIFQNRLLGNLTMGGVKG